MVRKIITSNELPSLLNNRLHNVIGNNQISFGVANLLVELNAHCSNWSNAFVMQADHNDIIFLSKNH